MPPTFMMPPGPGGMPFQPPPTRLPTTLTAAALQAAAAAAATAAGGADLGADNSSDDEADDRVPTPPGQQLTAAGAVPPPAAAPPAEPEDPNAPKVTDLGPMLFGRPIGMPRLDHDINPEHTGRNFILFSAFGYIFATCLQSANIKVGVAL